MMRDSAVLPAASVMPDAFPVNATTTQEAPLMATATHKLVVRGIKVTTRTPRRFVVVAVRAEDFFAEDGCYVKFATVEKRSDSLATARTQQRRMLDSGYRGKGVVVVIIDTATGEEV